MKQLLNTLFVTSEDIYLSLEGENVLANRDKTVVARYPLHTLQAIVSFSYAGASPALMGKCAEAGIGLAFCSPHGRFLARTCGESSGNVLLRREQYRVADDPARSCAIARTMIFGKPCGITRPAWRAAVWKMPPPTSGPCFRRCWLPLTWTPCGE